MQNFATAITRFQPIEYSKLNSVRYLDSKYRNFSKFIYTCNDSNARRIFTVILIQTVFSILCIALYRCIVKLANCLSLFLFFFFFRKFTKKKKIFFFFFFFLENLPQKQTFLCIRPIGRKIHFHEERTIVSLDVPII